MRIPFSNSDLPEPPDSPTDRKQRRKAFSCPHCPPNRLENAARKAKHGHRKPRGKDKRK